MYVDPNNMVQDLKAEIQCKEGIPQQLSLHFAGGQLENHGMLDIS